VDGSTDWVLTAYNFVQVNVVHSLSKYFGEDPSWWYMAVFAPAIFTVLYPLVLAAHFTQAKKQYYMTAFTVFYVLVFSALSHKEMRFLLPILPFAMIMCAAQVVSMKE